MVSFGTNGVLDDLGHTNMNSTTIYLGVELEDALAIAGAIEISKLWVAFTGGPKATFDSLSECCVAVRQTGHSLQLQIQTMLGLWQRALSTYKHEEFEGTMLLIAKVSFNLPIGTACSIPARIVG